MEISTENISKLNNNHVISTRVLGVVIKRRRNEFHCASLPLITTAKITTIVTGPRFLRNMFYKHFDVIIPGELLIRKLLTSA